MTKVQAKRILKLVDFLRKVPKQRFHMGYFAAKNEPFHDAPEGICDLKKSGCGTIGCAAGWAATMPAFKRLGLVILDGDPQYKNGNKVDDPLEDIFGAEATDVFYLRDAVIRSTATPREVANRLKALVKHYQPEVLK